MDQIVMLLKGAITANKMVGLKMNVEKKNFEKIINLLPSLKNPTVSNLTKPDWLAVEIVINEETVRTLIPKLKSIGAQGIIEYPLNKIIY